MTVETKEEGAKTSQRRLTRMQWMQAEALWAAGSATQSDLAAKYGVSEQAVYKHMKKASIEHGSKAPKAKVKVEDHLAKQAAEDAALLAARVKETKDEHYKMASGLAKLIWAEVLKAKQEGLPMSAIANNLKALDIALSGLSKARLERWVVLGLDRDDTLGDDGLPELLISELTAEQIAELRDRDFNEFEELGEVVVEEGDEVVAEG
jgi:DNA-binding Lrp family transcriptional regulator